ncbi:hypothetical protein CON15_19850 [Bacillus cereus]|uniref:Uncharacterized protein n=1 Tax=Bacillus thuringiensis TaxID=1428 RepID=A0A9X6U4W2_BACTU|nr:MULTISPECIES: hypothetical protein [Bacillus cereus group]MEB9467812.1 hypothetical protein [Bacillus cereus]OUA16697.1 hypothetical protein BK776_30615 [Bacillus thuringiensis serovar aizawai]PDZ55796.1 hypothetical protein CON15_19850 [Bacillus cereus]PED16461.1 hypothetical protein CON01_01010 [Bacillus thuringiensis]PFC28569.1 hypothetical protein CN299_20070 [Bacillus thuringiensis]
MGFKSKTIFGDVLGGNVSLHMNNGALKVNTLDSFIQSNWEENIKSITLVSQEQITNKSGIIGRAAVGGVLLGGAGAVVGALTADKKKSYTITITYHDGSEDLADVSQDVLSHLNFLAKMNKNKSKMLPMIDEKKQEKINDQLFGHIEREAKERRKKQVEKQQRMQQNNGKDPEKFPVVLGSTVFAIAFLLILILYLNS